MLEQPQKNITNERTKINIHNTKTQETAITSIKLFDN